MDLRSIINSEAVGTIAQKPTTPVTPVQSATSQQSFRDYHPLSVSKPPSQDFGHRGSDPYASPASYQHPPVYAARHNAPPPIQAPSHNELQSPSTSHYSAQSPYPRTTPSSSVSGGQYYFPPNQTPQSPAQAHPFPQQSQSRDSYPQTNPPPLQHPHPGYGPPGSIPNTPVGTPGGSNPFFPQQRSQSSHSISTPTSAHSQQSHYNTYAQESPASASAHQQAQLANQRQESQPLPLGPPISNPRQNSGGYPQPTSPYQSRPPFAGVINLASALLHGAKQHSLQPTRQPSTDSIHDSCQSSVTAPNSRSESSKRDRSMSVSPKTQPPSLPRSDIATSQAPLHNGQASTTSQRIGGIGSSDPTSTHQNINGSQSVSPLTPSPQQPPRKRKRYHEPPIWAQSFVQHTREMAARQKDAPPMSKKVTKDPPMKSEPTNGHHGTLAGGARPPPVPQVEFRGEGPLGPWEPSITGLRPFEEVSKLVADWLFIQVVNRPDGGELASRGVAIEIEAKLGQLIHKDTNERFYLPVQSECILADSRQVTFRSSMTEAQHKSLNDFLNAKVEETHPDNPHRTKPRVPIVYAHRRERDKFYELPASAQASLPMAIRKELNPRHTVKVRVSHDQKTGQLLAKIIKTRVADLDIYNPRFPLDCRISVNLEMRYDGDVESLVAAADSNRMPDRNKDRLSYTQSHYQIDLTQVTIADGGSKEKEHELEIEISSAAVREQGQRALAGEPHQYSELIEGLMDNVRVLTRNVPDHSATLV